MVNYKNYSTIVCWIKELLHSFNLPLVPVYTDNTKLYDGRVYIKDKKFVKYENSSFTYLQEYAYNKEILNLTKTFVINSSIYDQYTHSYLGDYLRFIRDYHKINLMGMYNCFNGNQPSRITYTATLDKDEDGNVTKSYQINTLMNGYNYYIVPVKFGKQYTIAIDAECKYELACILYSGKFIEATPDELIKQSLVNVYGSNFKSPFIYSTDFDCANSLWNKENILNLLIKIPKTVESSIVILEGDFTGCANVIDGNLINKVIYSDDYTPDVYVTKSSLLNCNDKLNYPFADRLVEYLLNNAITPKDQVYKNIGRVQEDINIEGIKGTYDLWDDKYIRNQIHNFTLNEDITKGRSTRYSNTIREYTKDSWESSQGYAEYKLPKTFLDTYFDVTGYVDKDVELMLKIKNTLKTKVTFDSSDDVVYAIYGWWPPSTSVPERSGYVFEGYEYNNNIYYNNKGESVRKWTVGDEEVMMTSIWSQSSSGQVGEL